MENIEQAPTSISDAATKAVQPNKVRRKQLWFRADLIWHAVISLCFLSKLVEGWFLYKLHKDVHNLEWSAALQSVEDDNVITPDVGVIQFFKRGGYSITLNSAQYTSDGLHLEGEIGNPTNLSISNLSLKFKATKQLWNYSDEYDKDPFLFFREQRLWERHNHLLLRT